MRHEKPTAASPFPKLRKFGPARQGARLPPAATRLSSIQQALLVGNEPGGETIDGRELLARRQSVDAQLTVDDLRCQQTRTMPATRTM